MKSTILLEMKCPQPNKPEATAARNQNSIGDRMEKKNLGRNQASSPLTRRTRSLLQLQQSQIGIYFPDGCLGDGVLIGDLFLGLIYSNSTHSH